MVQQEDTHSEEPTILFQPSKLSNKLRLQLRLRLKQAAALTLPCYKALHGIWLTTSFVTFFREWLRSNSWKLWRKEGCTTEALFIWTKHIKYAYNLGCPILLFCCLCIELAACSFNLSEFQCENLVFHHLHGSPCHTLHRTWGVRTDLQKVEQRVYCYFRWTHLTLPHEQTNNTIIHVNRRIGAAFRVRPNQTFHTRWSRLFPSGNLRLSPENALVSCVRLRSSQPSCFGTGCGMEYGISNMVVGDCWMMCLGEWVNLLTNVGVFNLMRLIGSILF